MFTDNNIPFQDLNKETPFPGDMQASYEEALHMPSVQDVPDEGLLTSDPRFHHNLADYVDESDLTIIGSTLSDLIEKDRKDREGWIDIITQGVDYMGIGATKTRNSVSTRHTDIYSSTMMNIGVRSTSKIHSTLFPAGDFVDCQVTGMTTDEIDDKSMRIKAYTNYFLRNGAPEYLADKKQGTFWMVFEGSVFTKVFYDKVKKRPVLPYVRAENVIINADASSINDAERITHEFFLTEREYLERVRAGEYKLAYLDPADIKDDKVRMKIETKVGLSNNPDDLSKIYCLNESLVYLDIKGFEHLGKDGEPDNHPLPYVMTKDKYSNTIIGLYRNWNENDPDFTPKNYYVQHKYFTGNNVYGFGLFHLLLGYAKAETELQQQLLKAAQLSNAPVLLMNAGIRSEKTQLDISAGRINQFNSFGSDFNANTKPLGFTPPNPITLELKNQLTSAMQELGVANQIKPDQLPTNMSATAMMGVLSTMHIIEDSLINDLYLSYQKEFQLLYNLFAEWLPDEPYPFAVPGADHAIMRSDFLPNISLSPSLDPNVSNTTIQLIVNDTINNLAKEAPDLYDIKEVHKRLLKVMKVNEPDKLFKKPEESPPPPPPLDPISESKQAMLGQPIKAYKWQDQQAYIIVHQAAINTLKQDESQDHSVVIAALEGNIQEREAFKYVADMENRIGQPLPDDPSKLPPEMQNHIAMMAANAVMQKQKEEQAANPPPMDPSIVMEHEIAVKEKGIELTAQQNAQNAESERLKVADEMKIQEMKMQVELDRIQLDKEKMETENRFKMMQFESENRIKMLELENERMKINLDTQSKAYESTLRFEKESSKELLSSNEENSHGALNETHDK